ncbi:MAG: DUF4296 domain-containing protein [Maribacter sp.]
MKQRLVLALSVLVFVFSCAERLIEKPDNLIPKDRMVLILKEMAIVNAAKGTNFGRLKENGIEPTTYVFEKFEIDSAQFVDSDRYYASQPLIYEKLYKDVEASLEDERIHMETAKRVKDSLNTLKKEPSSKINTASSDSLSTQSVPQ